jgi:hypothetical protein
MMPGFPEDGMVQSPNKFLLSTLIGWSVVFCAFSSVAMANGYSHLQPRMLNHTGIYGLREIEPDLIGTGVKFAIICRSITYYEGEPQNDYRPNSIHNSLKNKQLSFMDDGEYDPGISPHSTAICSILLGEDSSASDPELGDFHYQGVAPDAQADVFELWHFLFNNVLMQLCPEADVISASVGSEFEDWWTRGIEALIEHDGIVVVASIGNGLDANDPLLYPGASANAIGVGVVDTVNSEDLSVSLSNIALAYPEHSSFGPASDGRCKPDLVAPGNCLAANANEPNLYEATGNWASFSTPIVAGTAGLLVQKARDDVNLGSVLSTDGGNCVVKVLLMNSATKLPYWHKGKLTTADDNSVPLDHIQGAGMLNSIEAYSLLTAGEHESGIVPNKGWNLSELDKTENKESVYRITLDDPEGKFVTSTVSWNKHYSNVYPFDAKGKEDTNIRLELWAVDPNNPDNTYLLDYSDSEVDNVEHIYRLADPNYSEYEIVVAYSDADNSSRPSERYAVAWSISESSGEDNINLYDLNADGIVNDIDTNMFITNCLSNFSDSKGYFLGDINSNGKIDVADVESFMGQLGRKAEWLN